VSVHDDQPSEEPSNARTAGGPGGDGEPTVLTIGVFDGVHLGHRSLIERARELADRPPGGVQEHGESARVVVLAFDPSPRAVLSPERAPPRLTGFEQRADLLLDAGADDVLRLEPTPGLLGLSPAQFVDAVLMPLSPIAVVEGPDFCFGAKRAGDVNTLAELGRPRGFAVHVLPPAEVSLHDQSVVAASSSITRWLLSHGRVADAGRVLGRPYAMRGTVEQGDQRGRTIGFPTANLTFDTMPPGDGVYACLATLDDGRTLPCAVNIGERPTFGGVQRRVEAHVIGYERPGDRPEYGWELTLAFVSRLRDQVRFGGVDQLTSQLRRDVARAVDVVEPILQHHGAHALDHSNEEAPA
jgi:riboflavin kinase/FMN adenylyltransferase